MKKKLILLTVICLLETSIFAIGIEIFDNIGFDGTNFTGIGITYGETKNYGVSTGLLLGFYPSERSYSNYEYNTYAYYDSSTDTFWYIDSYGNYTTQSGSYQYQYQYHTYDYTAFEISLYERFYYDFLFVNKDKFNFGLELAASIWLGHTSSYYSIHAVGASPELNLKFGFEKGADLILGHKFIFDLGFDSLITSTIDIGFRYHFKYKDGMSNASTDRTTKSSDNVKNSAIHAGNIVPSIKRPQGIFLDGGVNY